MTDIFTYILVCATMTHLRTVELLRSAGTFGTTFDLLTATFYEICDVCRARGISVVITRRQSPSLVQPYIVRWGWELRVRHLVLMPHHSLEMMDNLMYKAPRLGGNL